MKKNIHSFVKYLAPGLKPRKGFTLTELLIAVIIGLLITIMISSIFLLNQRVIRKNNTKSELTQNARITIDLMSREIRQAKEIVTVLPADDTNPPLPSELQFEDGHVTSHIQYIKYELSGNQLLRKVIVYYFDSDPGNYVDWDDVDAFGAPDEEILETKIIGENFSNIDFYGNGNIHINLQLENNNEQIEMQTTINPRNI